MAVMRDYLQLFRVPNAFTALADVTMGFLFVHGSLWPWGGYGALAAASAAFYLAGMVLNDVWDLEEDRVHRPARPLVSGRIPVSRARRLGWGLWTSGLVLGWAAGYVAFGEVETPWRSGVVATALALLVAGYDVYLKRTPWGPVAMGGCRFLNVLLGMSLGISAPAEPSAFGFGSSQLLVAGGVGLYIAGVTWFARGEAGISKRWQLAAALAVMLGGLGLLGLVYRTLPLGRPVKLAHETTWWLLLALLAFTIVRRAVGAVSEPSPQRVQLAVTNALWSLIVLDAAVVLLVCHFVWALGTVALLVPTMLLGRWIRST